MNFRLTSATDVLGRTPATLDALLRGIDPEWAHANEGPDTFSASMSWAIIDGEETDWIPRALTIINLSTWVAHDLGHGAQVARVMAKHYGTDVGPWRDFLPVLADRSAPRAS